LYFTNCQIEPYVSAITTWQALQIGSTDATVHAFRVESATNRPPRTTSLSKGELSRPITFQSPGLFKMVRCDVHPWEFAYVSVMENGFFAVTDSEGRFAITNVPPGEHVIEAIHRKAHRTAGIQRQLTLEAGKSATVDFEIQLTNSPSTLRLYSENAR
jgi:hypothetical protein